MPVSLYNENKTPEQKPVDLYAEAPTVPLPSAAVQQAEMANYALGDKSPGIDWLNNAYSSGNSQAVDEFINTERMIRNRNFRHAMINEFAASKEGPITEKEMEFLQGLSIEQVSDPKFSMQQEFARKVVNDSQFSDDGEDDLYNQPRGVLSNEAYDFPEMDIAEDYVAQSQIANAKLQDLTARASKRGGFEKVGDFIESLLPFKWWWESQNVVDTKSPAVSFLPGNNWDDQSRYLRQLPPKEFGRVLNAAVEEIASHNVLTAIMFTSFIQSHGHSDIDIGNLTGVADLADLTAGGLKFTAKTLAKATGKSLSQIAQAASERVLSAPNIIAATGDTERAGVSLGGRVLQNKVLQMDQDFRGNRVWEMVPSWMNPKSFNSRPVDRASPAANYITDEVTKSAIAVQEALTSPAMAERLSPAGLKGAVDRAVANMAIEFAHTTDNGMMIANIRHVTELKPNLGGVHEIEAEITKAGGKLFTKKAQADWYASEKLGIPLKGWTVKEQGKGRFYISVKRDVRETDMGSLGITFDTSGPPDDGFINAVFGGIKTPEDLLSNLSRNNRHIVTHASQEFRALLNDIGEGIGSLPKKDRNQLQDFLNVNRDWEEVIKDPVTGAETLNKGRFFDTQHELEAAWQQYAGKSMTPQQIVAYQKFRILNDLDYTVRVLGMYRDLSRQGVMNYTMKLNGETIEYMARESSLPNYGEFTDDLAMAKMEDNGTASIHYLKGKSEDELRNMSKEFKEQGYTVLQVANPRRSPFGEMGNVFYIATKDNTRRPLDFDVGLPYNPGGHIVNSQEVYLKQATIIPKSHPLSSNAQYAVRRVVRFRGKNYFGKRDHMEAMNAIEKEFGNKAFFGEDIQKEVNALDVDAFGFETNEGNIIFTADPNEIKALQQGAYKAKGNRFSNLYEGDKGFAVFTTQAEARKYLPLVEKARQLLDSGNEAALRAFLSKELPMFTYRSFTKPFKDGHFNPKEPFVVAMKNESVEDVLRGSDRALDKRYVNFTSLRSSKYNLMRNVNREFTASRDFDISTISDLQLRPADKIDAYKTMSRALGNLINERFFKDYQYQAVSDWISKFGHALSADGLRDAKFSPLDAIFHPKYREGSAASLLWANAENNRKAIITFLNKQTHVDSVIHGGMHKLLSSVFKVGDKVGKGSAAADFLSGMLVTKVDNPVSYLRAFAFHTKLGLFNPVQIFTQAQSLVWATAVHGPQDSVRGLSAAYFLRAAKYNPQHLDHIATKASKMGWKKDEFIEMFNAMKASGWSNVEAEVAYLDDVSNPTLWRGTGGKFLDKGKIFFNGTERANRLYGWALAYKEFKKKNPTKAIGNREIASILTRADDLTLNMTRASNTRLQRGIWSIPLQFFTYQQRMLEAMLGKRLTRAEKARVFLTFSMFYGVPVATGVGAVPGAIAGAASTAAVEGFDPLEIAGGALKGAVGGLYPFYDDIRQEALDRGMDVDNGMMEALTEGIPAVLLEAITGNEYNFGDRYGPSGIAILKEITGEDKSMADIFFGVSGSVLNDTVKLTQPLYHWVGSAVMGDPNEFPVMAEDFLSAFKVVSTIDNTRAMYYMLNTARYYSKNGTYLSKDTDTWDALFKGFLGMSPRTVNDTFLMDQSNKEWKASKEKITQLVVNEFRKGILAPGDQSDAYFKRAIAIMEMAGIPIHERGEIWARIQQNNEDIYSRISRDHMQSGPIDERQKRQEQYFKEHP